MSANETILVTGATGQQGGAVARSLLRQGEKVRVLTRTRTKAIALESLGAEVVIGDLTDRDTLDSAIEGIKKVFLVVTPFEAGMEAEIQQGFNMVDAALEAEVEHLVYSSVVSSDKNTGIPHFETKWQIEQHIQKTGVPATIIRPVFFMENFYSPWFLPSIQQGKLTLPFDGDRPLQMISVYDIGEFGAAAFIREEEFLGQVIEIAGDELSLNEAMRLLSQSLGATISYQRLPEDEAEQQLGHDFAVMFRWFDKVGYQVDIPAVQQRWKVRPTKYQDLIARESVLRCFRKDIAA